MIDPTLALQTAFVAMLASAGLTPVYDRVPDAAQPPYVIVGEDQFTPDGADGYENSGEITSTIHAYYAGPAGKAGAKAMASTIVAALDEATPNMLPDFLGLETIHLGSNFLTEPDGKTTHAVLRFKTLVDAVPPQNQE